MEVLLSFSVAYGEFSQRFRLPIKNPPENCSCAISLVPEGHLVAGGYESLGLLSKVTVSLGRRNFYPERQAAPLGHVGLEGCDS